MDPSKKYKKGKNKKKAKEVQEDDGDVKNGSGFM